MHYLWRAFKIAAMKKCRKAKNCKFNISTTNYHRSIDSLLMRTITSFLWHYNDVIMGAIASQITSPTTAYSTVYLGADQRDIKAPRHWPLCGEFTDDQSIPRKNGQQRGKCVHLMTSLWNNANDTFAESCYFKDYENLKVVNLPSFRAAQLPLILNMISLEI